MKSTVEKLSPTRVRINVEVPFTELRAATSTAHSSSWPSRCGCPASGPARRRRKLLEARIGSEAMLDQVVNDALPGRYSEAVTTSDVRPLGQPEIEITKKEYGEDLAFTAEVDIRPEIDPSRPGGAEDHRRSDRGDRRGRRQRAAVAARPVRHADRCRAAGAERRLRLHRPVGHRRRQGSAGGRDRGAVPRGRLRPADRGSRRRDHRPEGGGDPGVHHQAGRRRARRPGGAGHRHRQVGEGTRATRTR